MVHMVQTIAVKDRAVFLLNNPPVIRLRELTGGDLMPKQDGHVTLIETLLCIVQQVWAEHIPALKFREPTGDPFTVHKYLAELRQKSDITFNIQVHVLALFSIS
mgnify:FL=1